VTDKRLTLARAMPLLWSMRPVEVRELARHLASRGMGAAVELAFTKPPEEELEGELYQRRGGVAVIPIVGYMMKGVPWIYRAFGVEAADTVVLTAAVEAAAADPTVERIVLYVDSPGGEAAGTYELAEAVWAARQVKAVDAFVSDLGASAAYYVASQAGRLFVNEPGMVGSIGTYAVIWDESKLFEKAGVTVHVVGSGPLKGAGEEGTAAPQALLDEYQVIVDVLSGQFVAAVARGRGVSEGRAREWATGAVWMAREAVKLGLVDGIGTFEGMLADAAGARSGIGQEDRAMADEVKSVDGLFEAYPELMKEARERWVKTGEEQGERSAKDRLTALREALEGEEALVLDALAEGLSVEAAKARLADRLAGEVADRDKRIAELEAEAAERKTVTTVVTDREPETPTKAADGEAPTTYEAARERVVAEHPDWTPKQIVEHIRATWPKVIGT